MIGTRQCSLSKQKWDVMRRLMLLLVLSLTISGCVLTKIVTVPLRVGGAVVSVVPVAGNHVHDAIDEAADVVDDLPI